MTVKKVVRKISLTLTVVMILALGTIFSGYAKATHLARITDFNVNQYGSNSFNCTNDDKGNIFDQVNSYPTILGGSYDFSAGQLIMYKSNGKEYARSDYYIQGNYPAPYSVSFNSVPAGTYKHRWAWSRGGGFHASEINVTLYT